MKLVIVEDEKPAAKHLARLLESHPLPTRLLASLDSVESACEWFSHNHDYELVFMDIHLADGHSFELFRRVKIEAPVIFTTAYDEYALQAFSVNSIDYLLKPIDEQKLNRSLEKLQQMRGKPNPIADIEKILLGMHSPQKYKTRFLIKQPENLLTVETSQIAYFMAIQKMVVAVTYENRTFPLDFTLEELEQVLNPESFFRLNRRFIASLSAITHISTIYPGKLRLTLNPAVKEEVFVSREKAAGFKAWLDK